MRPSLPRLVRVLPRSQLGSQQASRIRTLPQPIRSDVVRPPLIQILQQRKADTGAGYPSNIRIEPVLTKKTFKGVPADIREELRAYLKER